MGHKIWHVIKPVIGVVAAVALLIALTLIPMLTASTANIEDNLSATAVSSLDTTGPLTGDLAAIPNEVDCMVDYVKDPANNFTNYPPVIGAPEHTDAVHSGVNPCATFTGNFSGTNQVYQFQSQTAYPGGVQFVVFGGPNQAFLQGGGLGSPSSGQYVARFDPSTGAEIWRTYLANVNTTGQWIAFGSMAVLEDGSIGAAAGPWVYRLDPSDGAIIAAQKQPILGGMPETDANFDGFHVAPDDEGTILLKTQTRPTGCPTQGNGAMSSCQDEYGAQPNTTVVAVDPDSLENIAAIELDQEVTARPIVTTYNSKIYMYIAGSTTGVRVIWDPEAKTLTQDTSWAPEYLLDGQEVGDAPALIGKWVIFNTNAAPSDSVPICAVAVSQDDPKDLKRLCPWGTTLPDGVSSSESPGSFGTDPQNNMIYMQDMVVGGVFGVKLDQGSGDMTVEWSRPDWRTSDYFSLVGPADERVLISQYFEPDWTASDLIGENYTESVLWADAATGETIAQSAYNPSTALGSLPNVGYGGRLYMMGNQGSLYIYQVVDCTNSAVPPPTPLSTTNCSADIGSLPQPIPTPSLPPQPSG